MSKTLYCFGQDMLIVKNSRDLALGEYTNSGSLLRDLDKVDSGQGVDTQKMMDQLAKEREEHQEALDLLRRAGFKPGEINTWRDTIQQKFNAEIEKLKNRLGSYSAAHAELLRTKPELVKLMAAKTSRDTKWNVGS